MNKPTLEERKAQFIKQVARNQRAKTPETEDASGVAPEMLSKVEKPTQTLEGRKSAFMQGVRERRNEKKEIQQ